MSIIVNNIPLIEPSIGVAKGLYETGSGYKRTLETINSIKKKGIIKSGKEIVKNTKNVSRGIKKVMDNLPKAAKDLQFLINLYTKKEIKFDGAKTIEHVKQHFEKNKEKFVVMGVIAEFQGTAAAAGSFKDRVFRFLEAIGSKVKNVQEIVMSSFKDAIWLDADGEVVFSNERGLFKINGANVVQLSGDLTEKFIRLDTLSKLISKSAEKKKAYKDENNNKYYLEEKNGVARLKQFWDAREYTFVDRYIEGPWPELNSLGKSYKEEVQKWQDISNEVDDIKKNLQAGRYTTAQTMLKERRIKELQELINKDKRFSQNAVNPAIIDFLIAKAIESGIEPKLIQGILNGDLDISNEETEMMNEIINIQYKKDISDKEKEQQLRNYLKLHGYNINKFLEENDIGINQILKIQEQLQVLANTARDYNPNLIKDIGVANTFGFLNFVGGTAELLTSIPVSQLLGVGFSTLLMLLLSKTIKLGLLGAIKITKAAVSALWKHFNQEKLIPYEKVRELWSDAIDNDDEEEEKKWFEYMKAHYKREIGWFQTAITLHGTPEITEVKLEEKPIELFPKTNVDSSFRYRETKEDQKLDLIKTESKKLKSMPRTKKPKINYGLALANYQKTGSRKWFNYLRKYYPNRFSGNTRYYSSRTRNKYNIEQQILDDEEFLAPVDPEIERAFDHPAPPIVQDIVIEAPIKPPKPERLRVRPIVQDIVVEAPPIIDEEVVHLPNVDDAAPKKPKKFKAEKPEPNVSLNAFFGPKYIYKTPKQMKMYGKQSKTRNLKRKWSLGAQLVAKKFRS